MHDPIVVRNHRSLLALDGVGLEESRHRVPLSGQCSLTDPIEELVQLDFKVCQQFRDLGPHSVLNRGSIRFGRTFLVLGLLLSTPSDELFDSRFQIFLAVGSELASAGHHSAHDSDAVEVEPESFQVNPLHAVLLDLGEFLFPHVGKNPFLDIFGLRVRVVPIDSLRNRPVGIFLEQLRIIAAVPYGFDSVDSFRSIGELVHRGSISWSMIA